LQVADAPPGTPRLHTVAGSNVHAGPAEARTTVKTRVQTHHAFVNDEQCCGDSHSTRTLPCQIYDCCTLVSSSLVDCSKLLTPQSFLQTFLWPLKALASAEQSHHSVSTKPLLLATRFGKYPSRGGLGTYDRVAKIGQLGEGSFCHNTAMTTKTIPAYLADEGRKRGDDQLRMEEEAARIQPLHHGYHRTAKQPKVELISPVAAAGKGRKTAAAARNKQRVARKTATKLRKLA
jgi:hypothetical protein